jgi:hypothetical protein
VQERKPRYDSTGQSPLQGDPCWAFNVWEVVPEVCVHAGIVECIVVVFTGFPELYSLTTCICMCWSPHVKQGALTTRYTT